MTLINGMLKKSIISNKIGREIFYRNDKELQFIKELENNLSVNSYEQFTIPTIDNKTFKIIEEGMGFIIQKATS